MISVLVLTLNEELNLPSCLESIKWSDDIHIVDSFSTDKTADIAFQSGCHVLTNPFHSFAAQRNWALDHCPIKNEWVLFLDADERCTMEFLSACEKAISSVTPDVAGFYCCWKLMMQDRWLRRSGHFPNWQFRLVRKGRGRFRDYGHGQKEGEVKGTLGYIQEPFLHYAFSKGWAAWVERHNRYSNQEARARLEERVPLRNMFLFQPSQRNIALRYWLSRVPGWPLFRFLHVYLLKLGFLDGYHGFVHAVNMSWYEYMIKLKISEFKLKEKGLSL